MVLKFDKALELAKKYDFLSTEKLYCLYRLKKVKELRNSLIVLKSVKQDAATVTELENYKCPLYEKPKAILHIEAQMVYPVVIELQRDAHRLCL